MARRQHLTIMVALAVAAFLTATWLLTGGVPNEPSSAPVQKSPFDSIAKSNAAGDAEVAESIQQQKGDFGVPTSILQGGAIAPKLENKTAKAELGRASWKLLHTMMARFPEKPTDDDSLALKTYVQLFARLYPCGDCAAHFQKVLAKYPPQTSSRNAAAGWACFVHNIVNERLHKPIFDCNNIGDFYDCGCGEEGKDGKGKTVEAGDGKADGDGELKEKEKKRESSSSLSLEKEGLTKGG